MNPKVSVIVPIYNVEIYLNQCIESLINQTLDDIEIILVNDGSTDNSRAIIEKFANLYDNVIVINQINGGISKARNAGLKIARGEFISFIDSDDFIDVNMLEDMYNKSYLADIVVCDIEYFWGVNDKRNYVMYGFNRNIDDVSTKKLALLSPLFSWNKIYRRELLHKINIRFEEGLWYEDLEFVTYSMVNANKINYINQTFVHYRQRENSIMSTKSARCLEIFEILKQLYNRFEENNLIDEYYSEIEYIFIENLFIYGLFRIINLNNYKDIYFESVEFIKRYFPNYKKNIYIKYLSRKYQFLFKYTNGITIDLLRIYLTRGKEKC